MAKYYYRKELSHSGLNKYRVVKAESMTELDRKVTAIKAQWDEQWARQIARAERIQNAEDSASEALQRTFEANQIQEDMDSILINSLYPEDLDFEELKDTSKFSIPKPKSPKYSPLPQEPAPDNWKYTPDPPLLTRLSKKKMKLFKEENKNRYERDHASWELSVKEITEANNRKTNIYNGELSDWETQKEQFYVTQSQTNQEVEEFRTRYFAGESDAIDKYISLLLSKIQYPFDFTLSAEVQFQRDSSHIIIDAILPTVDVLPSLKSVSYVKSRNEFKETFYPESYLKKKYEKVIYQIVLQILNYVFNSLDDEFLLSVTLNGKINTIDRASGNPITPYVLSVTTTRTEFESLNLSSIDPKAWFRRSKGVSAASIADVTPIAPQMQISRNDSRFIEGYSVAGHLDTSVNLASMDWKDFENLIRELFEEEFNTNGGEVKITQASRDGGVDAVAFDPDPIRGGKIVIQAKRYTNVVGVSAVRDLYGTVLNEGATKGILVTTSHFGSDAYDFAKGKPLALLDGGNLLFLLGKHGHKARIDITSAKKEQKAQRDNA